MEDGARVQGRRFKKSSAPVQTGPTYLQRKDFYYDGVRRIQETIYRPDLVSGTGGTGQGVAGNDENPVAVESGDPQQTLDVPMAADRPSTSAEVGPLGLVRQGQIIQPPPAAHYWWTDREYVYGPDYVDELVCAPLTRRLPRSAARRREATPDFIGRVSRAGITEADAVFYMLQDANYNP